MPSLLLFRPAHLLLPSSPALLLEQMGWSHRFEHMTEKGFALDLARPESKLAIEVDGPSHYLIDTTRQGRVLNGATRFKSQLLLWLAGR